MKKYFYVYILRLSNGDYYVGRSDSLRERVKEHSWGMVKSTKKYLPCELVSYFAFGRKKLALDFEKYLKSGSGIAFRARHLV